MKERVERVYNSFKTGVILWIFAYLLLYGVCFLVKDFSVYNSEVMKLLDVKNFVAQLLIAGATYITLEIVLLHFVDNMIKATEEDMKGKAIAKSFVVSIFIIAILCVVLYIVKEKNIVSKYIIKLMMTIIGLNAVAFSIKQVINTNKYNKKLKEKINNK